MAASCVLLGAALAGCGGGGGVDPAPAVEDGLVALPFDGGATRAVLLPVDGDNARGWCIYRSWPDERLQVGLACGSSAVRAMRFDRAASGELLLLKAQAFGDQMVAAVYDARRNVPSGRIPGIQDDGVDLLLFDASRLDRDPEVLATRLPLGGFDNHIHLGMVGGRPVACGVRRCFGLQAGTPPQAWTEAGLAGYEFAEWRVEGTEVLALLRQEWDAYSGEPPPPGSGYAVARLSPTQVQVEPIAATCLPWSLSAGPTGPRWRCVETAQDAAELLAFDLARMPHGGLMDYGASNAEGRIAWSQAYYLPTLARLAAGQWPALLLPGQQERWRQRVAQEAELLARREATAPGYGSRRYSYQRSELTFALHLGRIAQTLSEVAAAGIATPSQPGARERIKARLVALDGTVEVPSVVTWRGRSTAGMAYRRGVDFWADGAVVPYNYISGYVAGLLASAVVEPAVLSTGQDLLGSLLAHEFSPLAGSWHYWWGNGHDGWQAQDAVSTVTPSFGGSRGLAHVTYRSMDAAALLALHRLRPAAVPEPVVDHLADLVRSGSLLPMVNAPLVRLGRPATLSPAAAYRHARSLASWEIASQPWALQEWTRQSTSAGSSATR